LQACSYLASPSRSRPRRLSFQYRMSSAWSFLTTSLRGIKPAISGAKATSSAALRHSAKRSAIAAMLPDGALDVARQFPIQSCPKVAANRSPFFTTLHYPPQLAGFRLDPFSGHSIKSVAPRGFGHFHKGFVTPSGVPLLSNMCRGRRSIRTANDEESVPSTLDRCSLIPIVRENEDAAPALGQVPRSVKQVLHDLADDQLMERWPRLMTARTAAAYCDERSPYSFRKAVGKLWPHPIKVPGKGARWLKEDLDFAIDRLKSGGPRDAADVL
jgi:hypothetical protein